MHILLLLAKWLGIGENVYYYYLTSQRYRSYILISILLALPALLFLGAMGSWLCPGGVSFNERANCPVRLNLISLVYQLWYNIFLSQQNSISRLISRNHQPNRTIIFINRYISPRNPECIIYIYIIYAWTVVAALRKIQGSVWLLWYLEPIPSSLSLNKKYYYKQ
jgi:hypothetical protein